MHSSGRRTACPPARRGGGARPWAGWAQEEAAALSRPGLVGQLAAKQLHQLAAQSQADAEASVATGQRAVGLDETLVEVAAGGHVETDAGVDHFHPQRHPVMGTPAATRRVTLPLAVNLIALSTR